MADRIVELTCPHCNEQTDCFILIGQNFMTPCEKCKRMIYFDMNGNSFAKMSRSQIKEQKLERDEYYNQLRRR